MIGFVLEQLMQLADPLMRLSKERREVKDAGLRAVSEAVNETYLYHQRVSRGQARDFDAEALLSRAWAAAAIAIRHVDSAFADLCEMKSEYWINPENWSRERIVESDIRLVDVRDRYRKLLSSKSSAKRGAGKAKSRRHK